MKRIAIIVSKFNKDVTEGLLFGAKTCLQEKGFAADQVDVFLAPGAFELPLLAKTAAQTGRYQGVVCLGAVIKGDTAHFEFISLGATVGLMQTTLSQEIPMTFGILTTYSDEQASARSQKEGPHASENKGREAALACIEAIDAMNAIKRFSSY